MDSPHRVLLNDRWYATWIGRYALMKLDALKNGQEAPSWLQVFNERVKWLQQESLESPKFKERGYLEKI